VALKIFEDSISQYLNENLDKDINKEAAQVLTDIYKHPLVRKVEVIPLGADICLNIYTKPISLKNPYGAGELPLGCLVIKLYNNHSFKILQDTSVSDSESGRSPNLREKIHPHVDEPYGSVCTGTAGEIIYKISETNDIPMLVTFMIEFLKTYNRGNPYWSPWFKEPCNECGKSGTIDCKWCVCLGCSAKTRNGSCGGCERWMKQSAGVAMRSIQDEVQRISCNMDEDEFIILAKAMMEMLKK
jgi:hypothetical protein